MIKYIGSKRRLIPVLGALYQQVGGNALDLFTGTTRVAQEFKRHGAVVTAVDTARYSEIFSQCYIETSAEDISRKELSAVLTELSELPGKDGYFTETFCRQSRFFQPFNGNRITAVRDAIEERYSDSPLYPILLTSLIEAADRVDSTAGVQMAYIKKWAPRSNKPLELRIPDLIVGKGVSIRADAFDIARKLGPFDIAYLDPPYNQHRYFTNYHIWETLVAWDEPEFYGVACKRVDCRDDSTKSVFNMKRQMPRALSEVIQDVDARLVIVSYNNESWVELGELEEMCSVRGPDRYPQSDGREGGKGLAPSQH